MTYTTPTIAQKLAQESLVLRDPEDAQYLDHPCYGISPHGDHYRVWIQEGFFLIADLESDN